MDITNSLLSGTIFSLLMGLLVTIIQLINPRAELKSYPEGIKKQVAPLTEKEKKRFKFGALFLFLVLIALLIVDFFFRVDHHNYIFVFVHFLIVLVVWIIFDLVVMDWLIFCTITPRYLVFKGTENHKEYKDYSFHLRGVLFGIPFSIFFALLLTSMVFILRLFIAE